MSTVLTTRAAWYEKNGEAHDVMVLKSGQVVEQGRAERLLSAPSHPYTQSLIQAFS